MSIKRIASITLILLGYIALAGATQNLIRYFAPKPTQQRYAEVRIGPTNQVQVLICKDWLPATEDLAGCDDPCDQEIVQDIYYWINLPAASASNLSADTTVYVNGPVSPRSYRGTIQWENHNQITINLNRQADTSAQPSANIACPANGTYLIRKATKTPFLTVQAR